MKLKALCVAALFLSVVLALLMAGCSGDEPPPPPPPPEKKSKSENFSGYVGDPEHGSEDPEMTFVINGTVKSITITLTWTDDDGQDSDPDMFSLKATGGGKSASADGENDSPGGSGMLTISLGDDGGNSSASEDGEADVSYLGEITITVTMIEAGFTASTKNWGLIRLGAHDAGNAFQLKVDYEYYFFPEGQPAE